MSKYFSYQELTKSGTADRLKIDNTPTPEIAMHLGELAMFLDDLREAWGSGIKVTSGFRCDKLNEFVGGSKTSAHPMGYAADIYPSNDKFEDFKVFVVNFIKDREYDQCILEKSGSDVWVHVGLRNRKGQQRKQCFKIEK